MDYRVELNNGQVINLSGVNEFDTNNFVKSLNSRISFINFGGAIVNKNLIAFINPENVDEGNEKINVQLNNGNSIIVGVDDDFNADEVVLSLNDLNVLFVAIGKLIINKNHIGTITPAAEQSA